MTRTLAFAARSSSTVCEPIKPAPPVTATRAPSLGGAGMTRQLSCSALSVGSFRHPDAEIARSRLVHELWVDVSPPIENDAQPLKSRPVQVAVLAVECLHDDGINLEWRIRVEACDLGLELRQLGSLVQRVVHENTRSASVEELDDRDGGRKGHLLHILAIADAQHQHPL